MTTNEKLDEVLRYLNDAYSKIDFGTAFVGYKGEDINKIKEAIPYFKNIQPNSELVLALQFLEDVEKYIARVGSTTNHDYQILYAGKVFIESGGYTGRHDREETERNRAALSELLLKCGAVGAAIGSLGLLLVEIYKLCQPCE